MLGFAYIVISIVSVAFVAAPRPPTRRVGGGHPNRQDSSIATLRYRIQSLDARSHLAHDVPHQKMPNSPFYTTYNLITL